MFTDPTSKRELDLDLPDKATLTVLAPNAAPGDNILTAKETVETKGSFSFEPDDRTILVTIGGVSTRYDAYSPPGVTECILLTGDTKSANLEQSWFAEADNR
ncbi:MAG: hypothetical protein ACHP84_01725 [Caulobacterales bacterium]